MIMFWFFNIVFIYSFDLVYVVYFIVFLVLYIGYLGLFFMVCKFFGSFVGFLIFFFGMFVMERECYNLIYV